MYQIGWFSSGRDKAARDLLKTVQNSIRQGEIAADIAFVFLSRELGESTDSDLFIRLVESYNIPLVCFSYQRFKADKGNTASLEGDSLPQWRLDYDREIMAHVRGFHPDLCVLAGYMLIVGPEMCSRYNMLNLHPAAPGGPTGTWQEVIWQLVENGGRETGVMMHLVTPELDKGPVVSYCTFPIRGEPFASYWQEIRGKPIEDVKREQGEQNSLFRLIRKYGLVREFSLIISTLKALSQGRVKITNGRIVNAAGRPINGYNLTDEIDKLVAGNIRL